MDLLQLQEGRKLIFNEHLLYSSLERILYWIPVGFPEGVHFFLPTPLQGSVFIVILPLESGGSEGSGTRPRS